MKTPTQRRSDDNSNPLRTSYQEKVEQDLVKPPVAAVMELGLIPRSIIRNRVPAPPTHPHIRKIAQRDFMANHESPPLGDAVEAFAGEGIPLIRLLRSHKTPPERIVAEALVASRKQLVLEARKELAYHRFCDVIAEEVAGSAQALEVTKVEEAQDDELQLHGKLEDATERIVDVSKAVMAG